MNAMRRHLSHASLVDPSGRMKNHARRRCGFGISFALHLLKHPVHHADVTTKLRRRLTIARRACYAEVKMHMLIQAGAESVNEGDCADAQACPVHLRRTGAVLVQALLDDPREDAQQYGEHRRVALHEVAQPFGHRQYPLTHWQRIDG